MSKDVVIAGVIVAACLGLVTVAFVVPRHKTTSPDIASSDMGNSDLIPTPPNTPLDPFAQSDPFGQSNNPPSNNTGSNPFAQFGNRPPDNFAPPVNNFPPIQPPNNAFPPTTLPPVRPVEPLLPVTNVSQEKIHVVASGETLGEISQKYYNTARNWKKIAEANKVDPSAIMVGQKLIIPVVESSTSASPTGAPTLANGERTYTVQKGDSYYRIAERELGNAARWKELEKLNNISAEDLRVGKTIKLPAKEAAVTGIPDSNNTGTPSNGKVHVVALGETLMDISKMHYGTTKKWKDIIKANPGVDPEGMRVGQKLILPDIEGSAPTSGTTSAPVGGGEVGNYTVKTGDTLGSIAERELGSSADWKKIVDANPGLDPRKLRIGQKLIIPGKSGGSSTPPPANPGFGFGNPGDGNTTPPPINSFSPTFQNTTPPPTGSGFGGNPDASYPAPATTNPPSSSPYPEPSALPESFVGSSGFDN